MTAAAINALTTAGMRGLSRLTSSARSAVVGGNVVDGLSARGAMTAPKTQRELAEKLVASALVMPALSMIRESPFLVDGPFAPGDAERRFGPLLDQYVADRIIHATHFPLIDTIVERSFGRGAAPKNHGVKPSLSQGHSPETIDVRA